MRGKEHVSVINREITFQGRLMVIFLPPRKHRSHHPAGVEARHEKIFLQPGDSVHIPNYGDPMTEKLPVKDFRNDVTMPKGSGALQQRNLLPQNI